MRISDWSSDVCSSDLVDGVIGNSEKLRPESYAGAGGPRVDVGDIMSAAETAHHLVTGFEDRARAFVQVQNGCDHEIGRASCREKVCPYGYISVVAVSIKQKKKNLSYTHDTIHK